MGNIPNTNTPNRFFNRLATDQTTHAGELLVEAQRFQLEPVLVR